MTLNEVIALPCTIDKVDVHAVSYSFAPSSSVPYDLDLKPVMLTESLSLILYAVLPPLKTTSNGLQVSVTVVYNTKGIKTIYIKVLI
jgi:hypothetical protein